MSLRTRAAVIAVAALGVGTLLAPVTAQATVPGPRSGVAVHQRAVQLATQRLTGWTLDLDGYQLDDVTVTATDVATGRTVASALSYGGEYELWVPIGIYDLSYERDGYAPSTRRVTVLASQYLEDVTMLLPAPTATVAPSFGSRARVGDSVVADPGTWTLDGLTLRYQWRADGVALPGATDDRLRVTPRLVRSELTVTVSASRVGHARGSATSDPVVVTPARLGLELATPRRSAGRWRVPFALSGPAWLDADGTVTFCTGRACIDARVTDGAGTATLPGARHGRSYDVTYDGPRGVTAAPTTLRVRGW